MRQVFFFITQKIKAKAAAKTGVLDCIYDRFTERIDHLAENFRNIMNLFSRIKSVLTREVKVETISAHENGVSIETDGKISQLLRWDQICRIAVYKMDQITLDLICIEFTLHGELMVIIHEDMSGYDSVVQRMHLTFENIEKDWYSKVVLPAFERNYRVIYESGA